MEHTVDEQYIATRQANRAVRKQDWKECWETGSQTMTLGKFSKGSPTWHLIEDGHGVCRPNTKVKVVEDVSTTSLWYSAPQARRHYTTSSKFSNLCPECFPPATPKEVAVEVTCKGCSTVGSVPGRHTVGEAVNLLGWQRHYTVKGTDYYCKECWAK